MPVATQYLKQNQPIVGIGASKFGVAPVTPPTVTKTPFDTSKGAAKVTPLSGAPAYGSNVTGFDPNNAQHVALADAGQAWWTANNAGDTAGMANAAAQGNAIRSGLQGSTYDPRTGRSTLGNVGTGGFGATEAQNEINAQIAALQSQLASAKSAADYQVGTNNQYLQDQLKGLQSDEAVAGDAAQQLQNRRGGFYSGGLDFTLGNISREYANQRGNLTRDIAGRNQQLLDQYGTQANQIASQLQQLQSTSPQIIRDRILQYQLQTAPLTGQFQGQQTQQAQQQAFDQKFAQEQFKYQQTRDQISDERDKRNFDEMVRQYGLDNAIQWYNAKTSRASQGNAANNANFGKLMDIWNATGVAPSGLESFGITPGQTLRSDKQQGSGLYSADMTNTLGDLNAALSRGEVSPYAAMQEINQNLSLGLINKSDADQMKAFIQKYLEGSQGPKPQSVDQKLLNMTNEELLKAWETDPSGKPAGRSQYDWRTWITDPSGYRSGLSYEMWKSQFGPTLGG